MVTFALPIASMAQHEDDVWIYAGNRIDFSTTPPTVTPVGVDYTTEENITSVADRNGHLVYWLNGTSLYNSRDEEVFTLPHGNDETFFYGLSIVPFPGRENVYLFVYPDAKNDRMVVSIADGSKDILHPEITEEYAEFPYYAPDGEGVPMFFQKLGSRDFWMLYSYDGAIKVYALTKDGFSYTGNEYPVRTKNGYGIFLTGCEMTPDRSKILATSPVNNLSVFIDLDTKTGEIKLIRLINIYSIHAFAFSSGNKYLYYSYDTRMYRIAVEKLAEISYDDEFRMASEYVGNMRSTTGDIKFLTSGGVYYLPQNNTDYLGLVRDCDSDHPKLDNKAIKLASRVKDHKYSWFLAFPKTYCYPYGFTTEEDCGGEVRFSFNDESSASLTWDFGDGDISNDAAPHHVYKDNGTYTVTLTVHYNSTEKPDMTISDEVIVKSVLKKLIIEKVE
ncbi:MAG: PKD domain-containing protein [Bacteroidales bacterium]|nr:PKD domain-containing protein [Bacteroidales bacterium]